MPDPSSIRCSVHPDVELVALYDPTAPVDVRDAQRYCPAPGHIGRDDHRCAWDGRPIEGRRSWRFVYCSGRCRTAAHRASKVAGVRVMPGPGDPNPGPNAAVGLTDAETRTEGQQ